MEFKKIDENRFQCLLMEEDLEDNNITLDDFFRNDTDKIHNLLEVVMEEAARNIDVQMDGGVMSLQLAPQPDHSILLTVSSGKDDFGNMLRQVGERAAKAFTSNQDDTKGNVIKNPGEEAKAAEFTAFDKIKDIFEDMKSKGQDMETVNPDSLYKNKAKNIVKTARAILRDFDGKVPKTHKELESLPGVGRKTANVVWQKCMVSRPSLWILMCRVSLNVSISQHQMLMLPKLSKT